jgi:hypothetical protein
MSRTRKTTIFIVTIIAVLFLNLALFIYENKNGLRFSRTLTFMVPILIAYFAIFKSGDNDKSKYEKN